MSASRPRRSPGSVSAAVLVLAGVLSGCAGTDDAALAPDLEAEVPDIRGPEDLDDPYVGYLDSAFREDLDAYSGQEVTVRADVVDVVSERVFTVGSPGDSEVEPVLVLATADAGEIDPQPGESLVLAATPAEDLDVTAAVEELGLEVDPEQLDDWDGETYLLTTILEPAR